MDGVRVTPEEYRKIDLRAHSLLAEVPLHDVWAVDLVRRRGGRTIVDLREVMAKKDLRSANPAVTLLFALRALLGRAFGWDRTPSHASEESFLNKLSPADRATSLVAPGTREGPFTVLFVSPREAIAEIQNATVHGFSVFALVERPSCYRLYWGIYVRPVGRVTAAYMRLIDPFRRFIVYPAVLRQISEAWSRREAAA
jgi:Protein of unknown function (DUF2867)